MEIASEIDEEHNKKNPPKPLKNIVKFSHIASILLLTFVATLLHLMPNNNGNVVSLQNIVLLKENDKTLNTDNSTITGCNLFSGKWVYDDVSGTSYSETECSFMEDDFACEKNGRKNLKYRNWRWQPQHCDLPRFNGRAFLEKISGKKLVFVGDSLNRNQWKSMLCLIESSLSPSDSKSLIATGNLRYVYSTEYNASIGFYWAPFLVESNCDNPYRHGGVTHTIRIKSIEKHARHWTDADILVFDSFAWWIDPKKIMLWGSFGSPDAIYKNVTSKIRTYEITLNTWSEWLEMHIDRSKTKVFFMSFSPFTSGSTHWGTSPHCYNQTEPIMDEKYWPTAVDRGLMHVAESTIAKLEERGLKVEYINITKLSSYREDAHPSIYRSFWKSRSELLLDPIKYSDCLHWCLPGVPDVWNQFLYAYIMRL